MKPVDLGPDCETIDNSKASEVHALQSKRRFAVDFSVYPKSREAVLRAYYARMTRTTSVNSRHRDGIGSSDGYRRINPNPMRPYDGYQRLNMSSSKDPRAREYPGKLNHDNRRDDDDSSYSRNSVDSRSRYQNDSLQQNNSSYGIKDSARNIYPPMRTYSDAKAFRDYNNANRVMTSVQRQIYESESRNYHASKVRNHDMQSARGEKKCYCYHREGFCLHASNCMYKHD